MNDQALENEQQGENMADNMAQNEEAIGNELNTDDSVNGMQHLNEELRDDEAESKLEQELAEAKDKYLRLVAEFENFRKRNAKERLELISVAGKDIMVAMLDVLDDCNRAQKQMETSEDVTMIKEGVTLVFNKLQNTLQQKGLKRMESINKPFDPDMHEAITEIPAANEEMVGMVIDEVQPGYYLNEKLIRHAKVVVGK